mgnify:CR=1 FL=1
MAEPFCCERKNAVKPIVKLFDVFSFVLMLSITITVVLQIIGRMVYPLTWTEEFVKINLMWIVYIALMGSFYRDSHVRIDLMDQLRFVPDKAKRVIYFIFYPLAGLVFSFFIIKYTVQLMQRQYELGQVTSILQWPLYLIVVPFVLGGVATFVLFVYRVVTTLAGWFRAK